MHQSIDPFPSIVVDARTAPKAPIWPTERSKPPTRVAWPNIDLWLWRWCLWDVMGYMGDTLGVSDITIYTCRRKFRSQTSDNMDQRWEQSEKRKSQKRRGQKRKSQKKEDQGARKGRQVGKHSVFPMLCGSGGSKSRLVKAVGGETSGQLSDQKSRATKHFSIGALLEVEIYKKCTPLWHEAHFEVKAYKTHHVGSTFGSWTVEKTHAVVARSTCPSQHV